MGAGPGAGLEPPEGQGARVHRWPVRGPMGERPGGEQTRGLETHQSRGAASALLRAARSRCGPRGFTRHVLVLGRGHHSPPARSPPASRRTVVRPCVLGEHANCSRLPRATVRATGSPPVRSEGHRAASAFLPRGPGRLQEQNCIPSQRDGTGAEPPPQGPHAGALPRPRQHVVASRSQTPASLAGCHGVSLSFSLALSHHQGFVHTANDS